MPTQVRKYNPRNGVSTYKIEWISQASAAQRSGRAGTKYLYVEIR